MSIIVLALLVLGIVVEIWDRRYGVAGGMVFFLAIGSVTTAWFWPRAPILAFLVVVAIVINAWGWVWNWYEEIGWYDEIAHILTPVVVTPVASWALLEPWIGNAFRRHRTRVSLLVLAVGLALGGLWEIGEWFAFLRTDDPTIIKSLSDTITDMICDVIGSFASLPLFFATARLLSRPVSDAKLLPP